MKVLGSNGTWILWVYGVVYLQFFAQSASQTHHFRQVRSRAARGLRLGVLSPFWVGLVPQTKMWCRQYWRKTQMNLEVSKSVWRIHIDGCWNTSLYSNPRSIVNYGNSSNFRVFFGVGSGDLSWNMISCIILFRNGNDMFCSSSEKCIPSQLAPRPPTTSLGMTATSWHHAWKMASLPSTYAQRNTPTGNKTL